MQDFVVLFVASVTYMNHALVFSRKLQAVRFKFEPFNLLREAYESWELSSRQHKYSVMEDKLLH